MKNLKESMANLLIAGGLFTTGVSLGDGLGSGGFQKVLEQSDQRSAVSEQLREKYDIEYAVCGGVMSESATSCLSGNKDDLEQYYQELDQELAKLPYDPRGNMDFAGLGAGTIMLALGAIGKEL